MIELTCPKCSKNFRCEKPSPGVTLTCPYCGATIILKSEASSPPDSDKRKLYIAAVAAVVILLIIPLSCSRKTHDPEPVPSPTAIATVAPTETPEPTSAATATSEPTATPEPASDVQSEMQAHLDSIKNGANGVMIYDEAISDKIYFVAFSNAWYAWTKEQKEYIINELYSNLRNKYYELTNEDFPISLTVYDENQKVIADSKMFGGMELK